LSPASMGGEAVPAGVVGVFLAVMVLGAAAGGRSRLHGGARVPERGGVPGSGGRALALRRSRAWSSG